MQFVFNPLTLDKLLRLEPTVQSALGRKDGKIKDLGLETWDLRRLRTLRLGVTEFHAKARRRGDLGQGTGDIRLKT